MASTSSTPHDHHDTHVSSRATERRGRDGTREDRAARVPAQAPPNHGDEEESVARSGSQVPHRCRCVSTRERSIASAEAQPPASRRVSCAARGSGATTAQVRRARRGDGRRRACTSTNAAQNDERHQPLCGSPACRLVALLRGRPSRHVSSVTRGASRLTHFHVNRELTGVRAMTCSRPRAPAPLLASTRQDPARALHCPPASTERRSWRALRGLHHVRTRCARAEWGRLLPAVSPRPTAAGRAHW